MNIEDLNVGNILVKPPYWCGGNYSFYRIKKETPKTVILDSLMVKHTYSPRENYLNPNTEPYWEEEVDEITDVVFTSFRIYKRIVCSDYELYDPNKRYVKDVYYD